jgi:8-oxo-dGTP pyrophosphatase MutT (NUDIX family)
MRKGAIRPIAICVFYHNGRILAAEGYDPTKQQHFYRPLGGSIEFGERSSETIARELREELGVEVKELRYLGTLENIFIYNGEQGHEIVLVYDGAFVDEQLYEQPVLHGYEADDGATFTAVWLDLAAQRPESPPIYPDGLLAYLSQTL